MRNPLATDDILEHYDEMKELKYSYHKSNLSKFVLGFVGTEYKPEKQVYPECSTFQNAYEYRKPTKEEYSMREHAVYHPSLLLDIKFAMAACLHKNGLSFDMVP
jgi:hypothetical protein